MKELGPAQIDENAISSKQRLARSLLVALVLFACPGDDIIVVAGKIFGHFTTRINPDQILQIWWWDNQTKEKQKPLLSEDDIQWEPEIPEIF